MLFHGENALRVEFNFGPMLGRLQLDLLESLLEMCVFILLFCYVGFQALVVLVDFRLTVVLDTLDFLNEFLHECVDFRAQTFGLFLEGC